MNTIPLPTETTDQREIVKALKKAITHMVKEIESFATHNDFPGLTRAHLYQVASVGKEALAIHSDNEGDSKANYKKCVNPRCETMLSEGSPNRRPKCQDDRENLIAKMQELHPEGKIQCTCGFDADGWRDFSRTDEVICDGDQISSRNCKPFFQDIIECQGDSANYFSNKDYLFRTRRHLPDCPIVKAPVTHRGKRKPY